MQTPPSTPSAAVPGSAESVAGLQSELLLQILMELKALRKLQERVTQGGNAMLVDVHPGEAVAPKACSPRLREGSIA